MPESGSENPQARRFRSFNPKEYRETKRSERKLKAENKKIESKQALSALSKDKPEVADRTDLESLANVEANPERKLLNIEMAGAQAVFLLGGTMPDTIDRPKIEAIVRGERVQTEKINKGSFSERDEYWNGEKSPYKGKTWNKRMEIWTEKTNNFLNQYKGQPPEAFLKRMGVDLTNENQAKGIYDFYFVKGKGDIGLFASTVAENNTVEQIEENIEVIQKLGNIYGENSAKVAEQLILGIKNAQTDTDLFIQSAQENLQKGENMPGIEFINILDQKSSQWKKRSPAKSRGQQIDSGFSVTESEDQKFKLMRNERSNGADKWYGSGELGIDGDVLTYSLEDHKPENTFKPGTKQHRGEEERLAKYYSPRGIELASVDARLSSEAGRDVKIPSALLWKILETNPEELGTKTAIRLGPPTNASLLERFSPLHKSTWYETSFDSADYEVKTTKPHKVKVKNTDGVEKTVEVNHYWKKLTVDKKTLAEMQKLGLDYISRQVAAGDMPAGVLDAANGIVKSREAPKTVEYSPLSEQVGGENPQTPKEHANLFTTIETWKSNGSLRQEGNNIIYEDERLSKRKNARTVEIATVDPKDRSRKILTRQAWDILSVVPKSRHDKYYGEVPPSIDITNALSNSIFDKGVWKRFVRPFTADAATLSRMHAMIRGYVAGAVSEGAMDESVLKTVDGIIEYKHTTLEPAKSDDSGNVTYKLAS